MRQPKNTPPPDIEAAIAEAMAAPYRHELVANDDGTWFASVPELPGCMTEGETAVEALSNLFDAMRQWLRVQLEDGDPIPQPVANIKYSGKFMVRVSPRLHRDAVECAAREGVSLNAFASTALARSVGEAQGLVRISIDVTTQLSLVNQFVGSHIAGVGNVLTTALSVASMIPLSRTLSPTEELMTAR